MTTLGLRKKKSIIFKTSARMTTSERLSQKCFVSIIRTEIYFIFVNVEERNWLVLDGST